MNILILSNSARGYYKLFNKIATNFKDNGHAVHIAVDCEYSSYINNLANLKVPIHVFSEFFAHHEKNVEILREYSLFNLNVALLPDYERAQANKVWGRRGVKYFDHLKSALLSFFHELCEKYAIEAVVFENVSDTFSYMAWYVCEHLDLRYCSLVSTRLPGRYMIAAGPLDEYRNIQRKFSEIQNGSLEVTPEVAAWCKDYLDNLSHIVPDYMRLNGLERVAFIVKEDWATKFRIWFGAFRFSLKPSEYAFKVGNPLNRRWQSLRRSVLRAWRMKRLQRFYQDPVDGERYVLYPLHLHPEASTSVLSGTYLDEYEVIRNIAFNLPEGFRVYVKDHMSAFGHPSNAFYESITRLPNVRFIEPFAQTKALIQRSAAVITLSSTVGYEALLMGKRVFLYGIVFYQFHRNVVRVADPSKLFELLRQFVDAPVLACPDYTRRFVEAYYLATNEGIFNPSGKDAQGLADEIFPCILESIASGRRGEKCIGEDAAS